MLWPPLRQGNRPDFSLIWKHFEASGLGHQGSNSRHRQRSIRMFSFVEAKPIIFIRVKDGIASNHVRRTAAQISKVAVRRSPFFVPTSGAGGSILRTANCCLRDSDKLPGLFWQCWLLKVKWGFYTISNCCSKKLKCKMVEGKCWWVRKFKELNLNENGRRQTTGIWKENSPTAPVTNEKLNLTF